MGFTFKRLAPDSDTGKRDGYATPEEVPGLTGLSSKPVYVGSPTSTSISIAGTYCKLYKYKYPGVPYTTYPNGSYFMLMAYTGDGTRYFPHSGLTFTRENTYPRFIVTTDEGQYSMLNTLVSTSNYLVARYRRAGWILYKDKWYLLFQEIYQHLKFYHSFSLTLSKSSFEVYEPTSSMTMSLSCSTMSINVNCGGFNAKNALPTTGTFDSTDKDEIAEKFGIGLPNASYSSIGERDFSCAKNIVEDLGAYYRRPGYSSAVLYAYGRGYYVITVDYEYAALDRPNTQIYGYRNLSYFINVTDFSSKVISIRKKTNDPWVVYAGKQAFVGNTSDLFEIIETASNSYKTVETVLQSSITKGNMSKYVFAEGENLSFTYGYANQTLSYTSVETPIGLADGNAKFANMTVRTDYDVGDVVKIISANDYQNGGLGYLTYSDGSTIDFRSMEWDENMSFSSSFGEGEHELTAEDYDFWVQYSLPTKHFGTLTNRVACSVAGSSNIVSAEIIGAKTSFVPGESLLFGDDAQIVCYDVDGEVVKTIDAEDFSKYITEMPENYGSELPEAYVKDGVSKIPFKIFGRIEIDWEIYVSYTSAFAIDASGATRTYYYDAEDIVLDTEGLEITETRHTNSSNGTTISELDVDLDDCTFELEPFELLTGNRVCNVTVTYENDLGQTLTGTYTVNIVKYEPVGIEITGSSDSTNYYDNDTDTFHYPTGLTFKRKYSDDTTENISDLSTLRFYRDENLVTRLLTGNSVIRKADGTRIYVYDPITNVSGYYIIGFVADEITNVYLDNNVTFTLGNRLSPFRDDFTIKALHASGNISEVEDFKFVETGLIMASQTIQIVADGTTWTLAANKITFVSPTISKMVVALGSFKTNYTNTVDAVDCRPISVSLEYEDAEYVQELAFSSDNTVSDGEFHVSNQTVDQDNNKPFNSYIFDGSTAVNVGMGSYSELTFPLTISAVSHFDANESVTKTVDIKVFEILNITGIHIDKVYGSYSVGDTFLNENDDTTATVYYLDANNVSKKMTINLNSGFSVLNIYPPKGTEFTKVASSRTVRVTSVTNYNVTAEYEISVAAKYVYGSTKTHSVVAVKKSGNYTLPNGQVVTDKYLLIARTDGDGIENTEIDSATGARILAIGKTLSDVEVFGYIDDAFDQGKSGRVILFDDYIPPVDGANNIEVKFPCYVPGNADKINKCHFGILFGNNNAKNRLFLSGNPDVPNCDWHSAAIGADNLDDETMVNGNFAYFEDTSYCYYGETDNKVIGYDIVANDRLLVLKDKSDKETTVYFRTPTLVTAIDGSGNAMTGINGETLYQEEFSLVKGNNSVAGISPKAVLNFNGDSLFISYDNSLVGMDLTGIVGDNQRYANSRSRFIDGDLRGKDLSNAWLWSDNKYLFLCLEDKTYVSHFELKGESQYEWFVIDTGDIQAIVKTDNGFYYGDSEGCFYRQAENWSDVSKIFIDEGGGILASEGETDNTVIVSQVTMSKLDPEKNYRFSIVPTGNEDVSYMYYGIGDISNVEGADATFFVQRTLNALELVCIEGGERDFDASKRLTALLREDKPIYLNHIRNENAIGCSHGNPIGNYYVPYYLKRFEKDDWLGGDLYKLYDEQGNAADITELYRATVCYKLDEEYEVYDIDATACSFKLKLEGEELDLVRYADQLYSRAFKAEIKLYENVEAFYITKPYDMGSLDYFKTVWQWTVTNDTGIPSELEITYASNKIPYEDAKTLSKISVDKFSFDFNKMNFAKVDFDKDVVPRTYTNQRVLSHQKFVCFGFKNYEDTNSVLSSMSIVYTIPHASYSGD